MTLSANPTVYFNGEYVTKDSVRLSPDDRGFLFADGVYEVVRAYHGRFFKLEAHLERMRYGLGELRIEGVDPSEFAEVSRRLLDTNGLAQSDATVYMQVTRGAAPRTHWFPDPAVPPTTYASAAPVRLKGDPTRGVSVITQPDLRWIRCDIKSVSLLPNVLANQAARDVGAVEAVLVRDDVALEATAASFFGVFDGEVRTAAKSTYVLPSITREVTLELCLEAEIPVRETPIYVRDLADADELFLAGTTVEIMPIIKLDGTPVGDGTPGAVTRELYDRFCQRTGSTAAV